MAVADFVGVERRTIQRWRANGRVHARRLPNGRWQVCGCSRRGCQPGDSNGCEWCRKIFGDKQDKWGHLGARSVLTMAENAQKFTDGHRNAVVLMSAKKEVR